MSGLLPIDKVVSLPPFPVPSATAKDGLYAVGHEDGDCIEAEDDQIVSKVWFTTPVCLNLPHSGNELKHCCVVLGLYDNHAN